METLADLKKQRTRLSIMQYALGDYPKSPELEKSASLDEWTREFFLAIPNGLYNKEFSTTTVRNMYTWRVDLLKKSAPIIKKVAPPLTKTELAFRWKTRRKFRGRFFIDHHN